MLTPSWALPRRSSRCIGADVVPLDQVAGRPFDLDARAFITRDDVARAGDRPADRVPRARHRRRLPG